VTLVILTFTIMSFTSVNSLRRHSRLQFGREPAYQGILLKNINWRDLPPEALGVVANKFAAGGKVAPRVWLEAEDRTRVRRIPLARQGRVFEAQGLVGLSAAEPGVTGLDAILVSGRWFRPGERDVVLLPQNLARELGVRLTDPATVRVTLWGAPYTVVGIFAPDTLGKRVDLDGEPLTPVTFPGETAQALTEVEMEALESGDDVRAFQSRYVHVPPELVVIVPAHNLLSAGGHLKGIALHPGDGGTIPELAEQLSDRFGLTLFSGEAEGSFVYNASDTLSYSGVPNILIPVVISILIVLNTMISSVYERKREIGIYTSVGLAPSHVAFLFIAEALAFAVLSVVMGYIVAQVAAKFLAGSVLWAGITVNYSSMAGVAAMVLVILVVLVSAVYPSKVAAAIAIPDVKRTWQLPKVHGNHIEITLPFLLKRGEERSAAGFLFDYFHGHQEITHGLFSTGELKMTRDLEVDRVHPAGDAPCLTIESLVWLAPFDLGVVQQVALSFCPSAEEVGFIEIRMQITRGAGEANAWRRTNKMFIHQLRKQMLVWRSLSSAHKLDYEKSLTVPLRA
jgi:hypothetical protein